MLKQYILLLLLTNIVRPQGIENNNKLQAAPSKSPQLVVANLKCITTTKEPKVTIADSDHLLVNWAGSFVGCDNVEVFSAKLKMRSSEHVTIDFAVKHAKVRANPCLKLHDIAVEVEIKVMVNNRAVNRKLTSHAAQYNDYNLHPKIEELYSGLLRGVIIEKICDENINKFLLSEI